MKRQACSIVVSGFVSIIFLLLLHGTVLGYDITGKFSIGGAMAGGYQYQWVDGDDDNASRYAHEQD